MAVDIKGACNLSLPRRGFAAELRLTSGIGAFPTLPGLNSDITYSLLDSADGSFSIDGQTGVISLERPLDRELQAAYELRAVASDQGSPRLSSVCQVLVSVLDINDNPPVFEHREYTATVSEDVAAGTQLLRVVAASRDAEANAEISYSIISGNEHGLFSVDPLTGRSRSRGEAASG